MLATVLLLRRLLQHAFALQLTYYDDATASLRIAVVLFAGLACCFSSLLVSLCTTTKFFAPSDDVLARDGGFHGGLDASNSKMDLAA